MRIDIKTVFFTFVLIPLSVFSQNRAGAYAPADSIAADSTGMRLLAPALLAKEMSPGWNIGNSLEAIGGETAWGNPLISRRLIDSVKAAGFKSVRIPVAWSRFSDAASFKISASWLDRVEEVVNYVLDDSLYAVINEHWDNGWMQPTYAQQEHVDKRLAAMWRQIALQFRDYGDRLVFAGMNEVTVTGNYGSPTPENYTVHNGYCQTFVNTVRSTGGRNAYRYLAVQGYNTNIDYTVNFFAPPRDPAPGRLLVEVHYYDPYNFTINSGNTKLMQWGKYATDPGKAEAWANEAYADGQFRKMKTTFIDKGIAVILGEYGAMARLNLGSAALNAEYARYRLYYMEYITRSIERHGLIPFYWDSGFTGNNSSGIFNRATGAQAYPDIIRALVDTLITAFGGTDVAALPSNQDPAAFRLTQNYPNPFNASTTISFTLPAESFASLKVFDILGKEVATVVSGNFPAGSHSGTWDASMLPSGIYLVRLQAGPMTETRKLVLSR
jgi:endoglucanase